MGEYTGQLYQPSNGTEGEIFTDRYCMKCKNCDPDPSGKKQCMILCASLCFSVSDPEYPKEWVYDENDEPKCTAHVPWDWEEKGDPDSPENPNYVQPEDPAQLKLFTEPYTCGWCNQNVTEDNHNCMGFDLQNNDRSAASTVAEIEAKAKLNFQEDAEKMAYTADHGSTLDRIWSKNSPDLHECKYCGAMTSQPDDTCYKKPQ